MKMPKLLRRKKLRASTARRSLADGNGNGLMYGEEHDAARHHEPGQGSGDAVGHPGLGDP